MSGGKIKEQIARYEVGGYKAIEGWLQPSVLWALRVVVEFHEEQAISGDICEIGIHHGRFFLALENAARSGEECVAIDVFENQDRNVDRSGLGDATIFHKNLNAYGADPSRVVVKASDSTSFEVRRYFDARDRPIRLFSVDGGHTIQHVLSDLRLAEGALADGGVIFVDDWFNPAFPSVTDGLIRFLDDGTLTPICSIGGKLLLSGISWHRSWLDKFKRAMQQESYRAKTVRFRGHDFWHVLT